MNHKTFCMERNIEYHEICVKDEVINKIYEIRNPERKPIVGIPDGCIDIQCGWRNDIPCLYVCGSFLEGSISITRTYERCVGIKFNPGVVLECFQNSVEQIIDNRYQLDDYWGQTYKLMKIMQAPVSLKEILPYIKCLLHEEKWREQHVIVNYLINSIQISKGAININDLVNSLGYSQRYIERIFKEALGFSIKKYAGIIRMQNALNMLDKDEIFIYDELGYYDQAHFIHEFKKFTSLTPNAYIKNTKQVVIV